MKSEIKNPVEPLRDLLGENYDTFIQDMINELDKMISDDILEKIKRMVGVEERKINIKRRINLGRILDTPPIIP